MRRGVLVLLFTVICVSLAHQGPSETRQVLSLDGVWRCYCEKGSLAYVERKLNESVRIAVPGGYSDVVDQIDLENCRNMVWYERSFFVPTSWRQDQKIFLRLDGISSETELWLNGIRAGDEQPIDIPIERDVTERLLFDAENRIALASNGAMGVGIPFSISLRTVPEMLFIQDVVVNTTVTNGTGIITYNVTANGLLQANRKCITVQVIDMSGSQVGIDMTCDPLHGSITIPECNLWWPMCMDTNASYLYTLVIRLHYKFCDSAMRDVYRTKIGFRTLCWSENSLMINGRMLYLHGVETSANWARTHFSPSLGLKDVALVKWLNGNVVVTRSVPSEKMLDIADELGLMVVLGSPLSGLGEVVTRYKDHPSVVLWSIVTGGQSGQREVADIDYARAVDATRPFTAAPSVLLGNPQLVDKLDIVTLAAKDISGNSSRFNGKPVLVTYGDMFVSESNVIRSLNYNPYNKFGSLQRTLDGRRRDVPIVGELFGNFLAYKRLQGADLVVVEGLFNRNREPTLFADFVRFKFREKRHPCAYRQGWCKYAKKYRRRIER